MEKEAREKLIAEIKQQLLAEKEAEAKEAEAKQAAIKKEAEAIKNAEKEKEAKEKERAALFAEAKKQIEAEAKAEKDVQESTAANVTSKIEGVPESSVEILQIFASEGE